VHAADMVTILVELAMILVLARAAGWLFTKIGQPGVVGEILAGILLGPSLLGTELSENLFPMDTRPFLGLLANLGLVLFMFVVGLELDTSLIKGRGRVAASVSISSILLPFSLGIALAAVLPESLRVGEDFWPFALFVGAAMSVTAFPVLARILTDRNMHRTETGGLALACAATDDILAWTLLAVVIAIGGGQGESDQWLVALAVPFALFALFVVRPQLNRLTDAYARAGRLTPGILSVVLLGLLLSSAATEYLHVHFIFGAFLFGAILPHEGAAALRHEILVRLEQISVLLLLPVFFLVSGLNVDLRGLSGDNVLQLALILAVAIGGKYVGAYLGARSAGVAHWQANSLGILMNTRGLTELVILNVGRELGLIGDTLFTMLVVMAVVTTVMTGPLLGRAYPKRRVARDIAEAERAALGDEVATRVLVIATPEADSTPLVDAGFALLDGVRPAEVVVAALEPQIKKLEMGSGLTDELAEMAAAMERQQVLVKRGEERGIPVRIRANPSEDVAADLVTLTEAIRPEYVVGWTDEPSAAAVMGQAEGLVALVGPGAAFSDGLPVAVEWQPDPDGDAAVVVACRIAGMLGSPLVLRADNQGRRYQAMRTALAERGVRLLEPSDDPVGLEVTATDGRSPGSGDVRVRAELDAVPVEWDEAHLGAAAVRAD
jgi:Kef-type K+ transport system membrane component KefB